MKEISWRYVKPLKNNTLIEDFEVKAVYYFSESYKKCASENNGGRPSKSVFDTDKNKEREFKALLSFNTEDKNNIWDINEWVASAFCNKFVAFGIDNFGNLLCFDCNNDSVLFWNHENSETEYVSGNFSEFINHLYE